MIEPLNAAEPATQLEVMKIDSEQVNDVFMCFSTGSSHEDANDMIASGGICYSWQYRVCVFMCISGSDGWQITHPWREIGALCLHMNFHAFSHVCNSSYTNKTYSNVGHLAY